MIKTARSSDFMYLCGTTVGGVMFIPKILNRKLKLLVNIGGLEWRRDKWSKFERLFLKFNTLLAIIFADIVIIDSKSMKKYIGKTWRHKAVFIPYGAEVSKKITWNEEKLRPLVEKCERITFLKKNDYWLEVARLEPDNNIHVVINGYLKTESKKPLVIIGDYTSTAYKSVLENILNGDNARRVLMLGGIYNNKELLDMLRQNCFAYIHAHSFGGTNPSLLEAMSFKNIILAHDNEFNREVCDDSALYFKDSKDLKEKIEIIEEKAELYNNLKDKAYIRVQRNYPWELVVNSYEVLIDKYS